MHGDGDRSGARPLFRAGLPRPSGERARRSRRSSRPRSAAPPAATSSPGTSTSSPARRSTGLKARRRRQPGRESARRRDRVPGLSARPGEPWRSRRHRSASSFTRRSASRARTARRGCPVRPQLRFLRRAGRPDLLDRAELRAAAMGASRHVHPEHRCCSRSSAASASARRRPGRWSTRRVAEFLDMPASRMLYCGMALGWPDEAHPINGWRSEREPLERASRPFAASRRLSERGLLFGGDAGRARRGSSSRPPT